MILIDYHESRGFLIEGKKIIIPDMLKRFGLEIKIMPLEVGDYVIIGPSRSCCIESKTAPDYIGSIVDGTLDRELHQMSANYDKNVLIIHGSIEQALIHRKLSRQIYANYMAGCVIHESSQGKKSSISVVNFQSVWDAVQLIKSLHDITTSDDIYREPTAKRIKPAPNMEKEYSIRSWPDVGPKRAKEFKDKFGTIKDFVNASREDLMNMKGIGKKMADRIWRHNNEV